MTRIAALLAFSIALHAADPLSERVQAKLDAIHASKYGPGSVIRFTSEEINAWARWKVPQVVPEGMRDERVELGNEEATGFAMADFLAMRQAKGAQTSWLIGKLLEGERPLTVKVRLESGGGRCIAHLESVQIGQAVATGNVLDFLVKTFFLPLYPDAKIDQPFDLDFNIDRIDIHPQSVTVVIRK